MVAWIGRVHSHNDKVCLVFDFDKTLTNGGSGPSVSNEKKIRGGRHSIDALRHSPFKNFILTARTPNTTTLEILKVDRVFQELKGAFVPDDDDAEPEVTMHAKQNGDTVPIAHFSHVYASGYEKAAGIEAIIAAHAPTHVYFFDDNARNAYEVDTQDYGSVRVTAYWWDLWDEELGLERSITPATDGSDFVYTKDPAHRYLYADALAHYGLTTTDCDERLETYQEAWDITARAKEQREAGRVTHTQPKAPGKLDARRDRIGTFLSSRKMP